jgi:hypothetical protein
MTIEWTGFIQIAYSPDTLEWRGPAYLTEDTPRTATWTVNGYADDETGELL